MKNTHLFLVRAVVILALNLCAATFCFAQPAASLSAEDTALVPGGGSVALTATVTYGEQPGALGWSIVLPADWSLVSVAGANIPGIVPEAGNSGTLEFAYFTIPANRAEFKLVVRYPAGATAAKAAATVLIRANGKLVTLEPAPVDFGRK